MQCTYLSCGWAVFLLISAGGPSSQCRHGHRGGCVCSHSVGFRRGHLPLIHCQLSSVCTVYQKRGTVLEINVHARSCNTNRNEQCNLHRFCHVFTSWFSVSECRTLRVWTLLSETAHIQWPVVLCGVEMKSLWCRSVALNGVEKQFGFVCFSVFFKPLYISRQLERSCHWEINLPLNSRSSWLDFWDTTTSHTIPYSLSNRGSTSVIYKLYSCFLAVSYYDYW